MSEKNALPVGAKLSSGINVYTIKRVIGAGGFGITYCAGTTLRVGNLDFDVEVAIKEFFLSADCMRDGATSAMSYSSPAKDRVELARKDFLGEARRLRAISSGHSNIVKINEVFEANNTYYYVMEYLEGRTLADYVASRGMLPESEAMSLMMPVVDAVAYLHSERITHLDIKPANIMLATDRTSGRMRPVLIDFGLSKHYDSDGRPTSTLNTQGFSEGYAPPEQYGGIDSFSPATDVYSLSATVLYCLTGRRLGKSLQLDQEQIEAEIPSALSHRLRTALRHGLELKARRRTPHAGVLRDELSTGTSGHTHDSPSYGLSDAGADTDTPTVTITRDPESRSKPKAAGRKPWLWLYVLVCAVIVVIIGAGVYFIGSDTANEAPVTTIADPDPAVPAGMVDLGLGVYWSESAVGYQASASAPAYLASYDGMLEQLTDGRRLPSADEYKELMEKCSWQWQTSPAGYRLTGPSGQSLFFPASGDIDVATDVVSAVGVIGMFWTSDKNTIMTFDSKVRELDTPDPDYGYAAFTVADK